MKKISKRTLKAYPDNAYILDQKNRITSIETGLLVTGDDNWLLVKKDSNNSLISIPKYCRVKNVTISSGREKFTIVDWPYANVACSVTALPDNTSRFGNVSYNSGAVLVYDYASLTLTANPGNIIVKAGFDVANPLPNGDYYLSLADAPHSAGTGYLDKTKFALTWFFINDSDTLNRYFHTGSVSLGCLTVGVNGTDADIRRWSDLADLMSRQRMGASSLYSGKLTVKNRPGG
ncbi:hypothetical protein G7074_15660 [Pedobacter sp. HDW13]|uniref:hypothetical protein n=1 Tax=Pedobacter sp. HDW13 TaxID=2714940 RepID=UPI00140D8427|nr:hypothetical protein [Pedobacter sp. HDW13]QIL40576.1 hypothetical protein G7074_15660 [Pedobacter sp. HDW13]